MFIYERGLCGPPRRTVWSAGVHFHDMYPIDGAHIILNVFRQHKLVESSYACCTCRDPVSCPWCRRWAWPTPWRRLASGRWGWSSPTIRVYVKLLLRIFEKILSFRIDKLEKSSYFNVPVSFLDNFLEMPNFGENVKICYRSWNVPRHILSFVKMYTILAALAMPTHSLYQGNRESFKEYIIFSVRIFASI